MKCQEMFLEYLKLVDISNIVLCYKMYFENFKISSDDFKKFFEWADLLCGNAKSFSIKMFFGEKDLSLLDLKEFQILNFFVLKKIVQIVANIKFSFH